MPKTWLDVRQRAVSKQRNEQRLSQILGRDRTRSPGLSARRRTAAIALSLVATSPHALAAETDVTASTNQTEPEGAIIDPDEVVDSDETLNEHLTREGTSPNSLCVLVGREQRYVLALPLRVERVWRGCHGPDHLRLDDKRFFTLVGREDLWRRQRGRNQVFFALDAGAVAFVIGGVAMAIYGLANSKEPGAGTWFGAGLATAIAGPSLLSIVRFALPLQTTTPEEAVRLSLGYHQAHSEAARLPRASEASAPGFAMSLVDLRF